MFFFYIQQMIFSNGIVKIASSDVVSTQFVLRSFVCQKLVEKFVGSGYFT